MNRILAVSALVLLPALAALADDPPPPPPQGVFIGKGQFGFLDSRGNSTAQSLNTNLDVMRYDGPWKNELYVGGLYGKSAGIVSAERWEVREQTNYDFTPRLFTFAGVRFEHDMYDGFVYQGAVTGGVGYKVLDTQDTKFNVQAGAGYRRLRPEELIKDADGAVIGRIAQPTESGAIGTLGADFSHAFNKSTTLTDKLLVETGSANTLAHNDLALAVKMSQKLALSAGYGILYNTAPGPGLKKLDTVATVNVVFSF
jgi:putative salt-induced outer membrane protein